MKFLKVFTGWAIFSFLWWLFMFVIIFSSSRNASDGGFMTVSPRAGAEYLVQTYGLGAYVIISIILIVFKSLIIYKKKK